MLGLEPLYLACEGTMVIIAPKEEAQKIVETLHQCPYSENAAIIGEITEVYPDKSKLRASVSVFGRETPVELEYKQIQKI